jgi:AcrR family transcriptional regulator
MSIASPRTPTRRAPQLPAAAAQERLLDAAQELFYRDGVRAVGVEAVVEQAGVNKMSLYRCFTSKDELMLAYLERMEQCFFARFDASVAQHPDDARAQLVQYFDDLSQRASDPEYRGCPFVNVAAEFPDPQHPARRFVAEHKARVLARLGQLARQAGAAQPEALALSLALLIEGVYATSQTYANAGSPVTHVPQLARLLIEGHCA